MTAPTTGEGRDLSDLAGKLTDVGVTTALLALSGQWSNLPDGPSVIDPIRGKGWLEAYPHRYARRHSYRLNAAGMAARASAVLRLRDHIINGERG